MQKLVPTRPVALLGVNAAASVLKRFYVVQREMVLMEAGWLAAAEHWECKLLLAECIWQDGLTLKELRGRVLELRYPERRLASDDDRPLVDFVRGWREAPGPAAFVAGLSTVLKPWLRGLYAGYLGISNPLNDAPSNRILHQAVSDMDDQLVRWSRALSGYLQVYPEQAAAAQDWEQALRRRLTAVPEDWILHCRDPFLPEALPPPTGAVPFGIARLGRRDKRFASCRFGWPDMLDPERGPGEGLHLQLRQCVHHLNEVWAVEMAAAIICDFSERAPPEFLDDATRWCYDEARHARMGFVRLEKFGFAMEEMPLGSFSYDAAAESDSLIRLGILYYFETKYIKTKSDRVKIFSDFGDPVSSHDMDYDWADELIHTYYGNRWLTHLLEQEGRSSTVNEIKGESERCIARIRADATEKDRGRTEELYEAMLRKAKSLAVLP